MIFLFFSDGSENQWTTSWWLQFKVLLSRGVKERRHESYSGLRIFQVMSVSILSGLLWWHSGTVHIQDQVPFLIKLVAEFAIKTKVIELLRGMNE